MDDQIVIGPIGHRTTYHRQLRNLPRGRRCNDNNKKCPTLIFPSATVSKHDLLYYFMGESVVCEALWVGSGHHCPHCPMLCWREFWQCLECTGRSWPCSLALQNKSPSLRPLNFDWKDTGSPASSPGGPSPIHHVLSTASLGPSERTASSVSSRWRLWRQNHPRGGAREALRDDECEAEIHKCLCSLVLITQDHQQL